MQPSTRRSGVGILGPKNEKTYVKIVTPNININQEPTHDHLSLSVVQRPASEGKRGRPPSAILSDRSRPSKCLKRRREGEERERTRSNEASSCSWRVWSRRRETMSHTEHRSSAQKRLAPTLEGFAWKGLSHVLRIPKARPLAIT